MTNKRAILDRIAHAERWEDRINALAALWRDKNSFFPDREDVAWLREQLKREPDARVQIQGILCADQLDNWIKGFREDTVQDWIFQQFRPGLSIARKDSAVVAVCDAQQIRDVYPL